MKKILTLLLLLFTHNLSYTADNLNNENTEDCTKICLPLCCIVAATAWYYIGGSHSSFIEQGPYKSTDNPYYRPLTSKKGGK